MGFVRSECRVTAASMTSAARAAIRSKGRRLARAKASPLGQRGPLPDDRPLSPYEEELADALFDAAWEYPEGHPMPAPNPMDHEDYTWLPKHARWPRLPELRRTDPKKVRDTLRDHPIIPSRPDRRRSVGDRQDGPQLVRVEVVDDDDGQERILDPFDEAASAAYFDDAFGQLPDVDALAH